MQLTRLMIASASVLVLLAGPVLADWFPGQPHKMHYPQLPDPQGWDVNATYPKVLADDWMCSETGPVSDVHVWGSWEFGQQGRIQTVHVSIHDDIPAGTGGVPYSRPGPLLWERDFPDTAIKVIDPWGSGPQGWYDPNTGLWRRPDHELFHQINIEDISDPFYQEQGHIYWLDIYVITWEPGYRWGWKTSLQHWNDDAVWSDYGTGLPWQELRDPITQQSLDLAFVITPEPGSVVLLLLAGTLTIARRRRP